MRIVKAVLISRHANDGTSFVYETVPLGKDYLIDLDSLEWVSYYNTKAEVTTMREVVMAVDEQGKPQGLLPIELLAIGPLTLSISEQPALMPKA